MKCKDYKQRQKLDGIDPELADIIVGGTAIFRKIANMVQCSKIIISGRGLREGFTIWIFKWKLFTRKRYIRL